MFRVNDTSLFVVVLWFTTPHVMTIYCSLMCTIHNSCVVFIVYHMSDSRHTHGHIDHVCDVVSHVMYKLNITTRCVTYICGVE